MIKPVGIDHIVLRTDNLAAMIGFYTQVLGCTVERQLAPEVGLTQLRAGNALIDLVRVDSRLGKIGGGPPSASENNLDHFCLQIQAISENELIDYLKSQQVDLGDIDERYGAQGFGRSIYIRDPDGNTVELKAKM